MGRKYCTIDEDELKELMEKVAGIKAWIRNDANIEEIQKRVNVLEYLLQKIERKLTNRVFDGAYWVCKKCGQRNDDTEHFECVACGSLSN